MHVAPKVVGLLCLGFCSPFLCAQTGFGNLRVGQSVSAIPFPCADVVACEGEFQSSWVRVRFNNGTISNIHVMYTGKTRAGDAVEVPPITLAQTIRVHSLQDGMKPPIFSLAQRRDGSVFGLVDTENQIVYITDSTAPGNPVEEVVYVRLDAPVLLSAAKDRLPDGGDSLVQAARAAAPYANQSRNSHFRRPDAATTSRAEQRIEIPPDLRSLEDRNRRGGGRTASARLSGLPSRGSGTPRVNSRRP